MRLAVEQAASNAMFIKVEGIVFLIAVVVLAMFAEWQYFAVTREAKIVHHFHGLCNGGVGMPYVDFIHELRVLNDSGDANALSRALRRADEHSHDIYHVWLDDKPTAYRESTQDILK